MDLHGYWLLKVEKMCQRQISKANSEHGDQTIQTHGMYPHAFSKGNQLAKAGPMRRDLTHGHELSGPLGSANDFK